VIAQAPRRADDDLCTIAEVAPLARGVHAADTSRDARTGRAIEPHELAADLQREFTRRRDDQRQRRRALANAAILADQLWRHRKPEGDGLARSGLRRDDQVAALRFGFQHGLLDGGERVIAVRIKRVRQNGGNGIKRHGISIRVMMRRFRIIGETAREAQNPASLQGCAPSGFAARAQSYSPETQAPHLYCLRFGCILLPQGEVVWGSRRH
jgi:hypothetical protein